MMSGSIKPTAAGRRESCMTTAATVPLRALILEDSENDCALLVRALTKGGYNLQYQRVDSAEKPLASLESATWDIIISDFSMPNRSR
jgi:CheY-like chemotaxis protein